MGSCSIHHVKFYSGSSTPYYESFLIGTGTTLSPSSCFWYRPKANEGYIEGNSTLLRTSQKKNGLFELVTKPNPMRQPDGDGRRPGFRLGSSSTNWCTEAGFVVPYSTSSFIFLLLIRNQECIFNVETLLSLCVSACPIVPTAQPPLEAVGTGLAPLLYLPLAKQQLPPWPIGTHDLPYRAPLVLGLACVPQLPRPGPFFLGDKMASW